MHLLPVMVIQHNSHRLSEDDKREPENIIPYLVAIGPQLDVFRQKQQRHLHKKTTPFSKHLFMSKDMKWFVNDLLSAGDCI